MLPDGLALGIISNLLNILRLPAMRQSCLLFGVVVATAGLVACGGGSSVVSNAQPLPGAELRAQAPAATGAQQDDQEDLVPARVGVPNDSAVVTNHRIAAGDVLDIEVFQAEELSTTERVNDGGAIVMPLINAVPVAGLTTAEAEQRIAAALAKDYLQNPQVNVFVSEFADMEISIGGEVEAPGVFPIRGRTTLLEGIALAGGTKRTAKENEVVLFRSRPASADVDAYVVDLKKVQTGELSDPLLAANDKIVVPKSGTRVFIEDVRDTLRGFISFNPLFY